ncbi:uncharacterized protein LOC123430458 [Hordeum vulgare subsp. vulgare]|uniref:uncharacterized protein LOC123430458 n=1 Tax=Hordeum vulgare subsp. vulgare TaxID=112509 RepID=UPI001D1A5759|nr:uncharacterized protein LOC123430458 [Hordeum vulgare subsp. vulgare]
MGMPRRSSLSGEIPWLYIALSGLVSDERAVPPLFPACSPGRTHHRSRRGRGSLLDRRLCLQPWRGAVVPLLLGACGRSMRTRRIVLVPLVASPWPEVAGADQAVDGRAPRSSSVPCREQEGATPGGEREKGAGPACK